MRRALPGIFIAAKIWIPIYPDTTREDLDSTVISRLTDENVDLAQRIALLEERLSRPTSEEP